MSSKPKIVVITGAESTGKSTLTSALANYYNVPSIPEIAREYIEKLEGEYKYQDVETIAGKQIKLLNEYSDSAYPYIFVDTWLLITKIWFEVVFKRQPEWLESVIQNTKIDLYLVCDTDLPWIPDSVRENGGKERLLLHKRYIKTLESYQCNYRVVQGKGQKRIENALIHLDKLK